MSKNYCRWMIHAPARGFDIIPPRSMAKILVYVQSRHYNMEGILKHRMYRIEKNKGYLLPGYVCYYSGILREYAPR